jgi:diacylglycerol kinase (CTP)
MAAAYQVPATPRVISPSPTPSEASGRDGYFGPVTRSKARGDRMTSQPPIEEDSSGSDRDPEKRARTRSRSPGLASRRRLRRMSGMTPLKEVRGKEEDNVALPNGSANGHLSPESAGKRYWRTISRSPSPLGLIPIHEKWRVFVSYSYNLEYALSADNLHQIHRHEIPRKVLHVSIGFFTCWFYASGFQVDQIHPWLLAALIPIATTDLLRHRWEALNQLYIRVLGALMRETEVDGYNGVIWYLLGAWIVLRFFPKDVAVMGVLLLSWCDTAASTFGRLYGRYTPRIRKGKSMAGTFAALLCGVGTAVLFWGWLAPLAPASANEGIHAFAFQGHLSLPERVRGLLGWTEEQSTVTGNTALGIMSTWAGIVGSFSEAVDIFGWDDNLTIPVLCGAGLWAFLKVFG